MLTPTEKRYLPQLRQRFNPVELNEDQEADYNLVKWLRKYENNLDKAETGLRKCLQYRKDNNLDTILTWKVPPEVLVLLKVAYIGQDKDNYPILYFNIGQSNISKLIETNQRENGVRYLRYLWEFCANQYKGNLTRNKDYVNQFITIFDLQGVSYMELMKKSVMSFNLDTLREGDEYIPESIRAFYFINVGKMFSLIFPLCKACVSPNNRAAMHAYGPPSKWKPILEEHIPQHIMAKIINQNGPSA